MRILEYLFGFELMQYRWYRKIKGGSWYYMQFNLPMCPFWSNEKIFSCGMQVIKEEHYK